MHKYNDRVLKLDIGHDFLCGHAEWYMIFQKFKQILIHALELKLRHFEVFPICLYREAMHLQCVLHPHAT